MSFKKKSGLRFLDDLLNIIFPNPCCTCSRVLTRSEQYMCFRCRSSLPKTKFKDLKSNELTRRFYGRISLDYGFSYLHFFKSGITQQLLHQLKYKNYPELGDMMGRWLGHSLAASPVTSTTQLIIPVPLHPKRQKQRGYNQSKHIADGISEMLKIPVDTSALTRRSSETSQTHKSRDQRWRSVARAFDVTANEKVAGKHILLVDDVVTTGATIEACARKLLRSGAASISVATIALAELN